MEFFIAVYGKIGMALQALLQLDCALVS